MTNMFEIVKEKISFESVCSDYRIEFDRTHKANCPFHDDHNPSLSLHPSSAHAKCFIGEKK